MDKVLGTFYKGNVNRFGLGVWNSVKDDFNEVSKSQVKKNPFTNYINDPSSIYTCNKVQKYNHFSPNLIRSEYFNHTKEEMEHKRNLQMQDYLNNSKYNKYYNQYDPLLDRRKNVQKRLENIKNKLINDEEKKLIRKGKKIEEENKFIDNLILENEKKSEDDLFRIIDSKNNLYDNDDFESIKEETESAQISNDYPKKKSVLILSRTSSKENTSSYKDLDLFEEENENIIMLNRSFFSTKISNTPKKRTSASIRNSISHNNNHHKKKHTDILKVMMNIEKYSVPINNVSNEIFEQSKQAGDIFNGLFHDIKQLKVDVKDRIAKLNEDRENNINIFKDILFMSDNKNIKISVDNEFFRTGKKKIKSNKNYLDSEINIFRKQIDKNIYYGIENFEKERLAQIYDIKLKNEPLYMENDYNLRIKGNERSKYGLINLRNLYNKIDKMPIINIKPQKVEDENLQELSSSDTIKSNLFTFSNHSKNTIFPALQGIKEKITKVKSSESDKKVIKKPKKAKNKKKRKNAFVKDLGIIDEGYEGHKDPRKERKETVIDFKKYEGIEGGVILLNSENKTDNGESNKENNNKTRNEKSNKKSGNYNSKNEDESKKKASEMESNSQKN